MTFISYSQNMEDVLLWRALGHVKNGFYIDVGANHPLEHSVTKAFYDAGWSGINIEPLPRYHQLFEQQRARDINLAIAAGASEGSITLFDVPAVEGWASSDRAVAEAHRADGFELAELSVPMRTLGAVCAEHVRADIHFLKVDVEGFEGEVLRGMDFVTWRPWVLVIEATLPNSRVTNHAAWEQLVTTRGYRFAHFDGLNRYYVADEHAGLLEVLSVQPNVFDDFISYHLDSAWKANEAASASMRELGERAAQAANGQWQAEQKAGQAEQRADQAAHRADHAGQRADLADAALRQALAHADQLLAKYEDAERRAALVLEQRLLLQADNDKLRELLARGGAELEAVHARLAAAQQQLAAQIAEAQQALHASGVAGHQAQMWGRELEQRLLATLDSTSWRVTRPLRWLGSLGHGVTGPALREQARRQLGHVIRRIGASERMRRLFIPLLRRYPARAAQLSQVLGALKQPAPAAADAPPAAPAQMSDELRALPVSARKVLADLQRTRSNSTDT